MQKHSSQIVENKLFLKREGRKEDGAIVWENNLHRMKVVELLKKQAEMCVSEESMGIWTAEIERVLLPMDTSFFKNLEGRARQRLIQTAAFRPFRNEYSHDARRSVIEFVQISSDET